MATNTSIPDSHMSEEIITPLDSVSTVSEEQDDELNLSHALIPMGHQTAGKSSRAFEDVAPGAPITRLPVGLDVAVPVRSFKVRNLLALTQGQVVETLWNHGEDLPLAAGEVQLAWTEFEVVDTRLAVRITRLA